jgi:hypothetical protein
MGQSYLYCLEYSDLFVPSIAYSTNKIGLCSKCVYMYICSFGENLPAESVRFYMGEESIWMNNLLGKSTTVLVVSN